MKNSIFFFLAAAALTLTSCDETLRPGPDPKPSDQEITFSASSVAAYTKAVVEGTTFPTDRDFLVFGKQFSSPYILWQNGTDFMFSGSGAINVPAVASYVAGPAGPAACWRTDESFYWPRNGDELGFIALSPSTLTSFEDYVPEISVGNTGFEISGFFNYPQTDILYADPVINQTEVTDPANGQIRPVQINFKHAMAAIGVNVSLAQGYTNTITISRIDIVNIASCGDFRQNLPVEENIETTPYWTNLTAENYFLPIIKITDESDLTLSPASDQPKNYDFHTVIPQMIGEGKLRIKFSVNEPGADSAKVVDAEIPLAEIFEGEDSFEMGKKYMVNLILNIVPNEISFSPTVTDWETVEKTYTLQ